MSAKTYSESFFNGVDASFIERGKAIEDWLHKDMEPGPTYERNHHRNDDKGRFNPVL
jgi:hypothetical protein